MRTFKTEKEAISLANDTEFGLAAAVMCNDLERCDRVANQLQAGTVWINCSQPLFPQCPFGGMKTSGIGRYLLKGDSFLTIIGNWVQVHLMRTWKVNRSLRMLIRKLLVGISPNDISLSFKT